MMGLNLHGVRAIYRFEMNRAFRTWAQSLIAPVLSTSLYFIVFGSAIGSRMGDIGGVDYGAFIIPGLLMLSLLSESISNSAFGIYMPKWSGTIYELLSAPVNWVEVLLGYVGAAATKSLMVGALILATARVFVPYEIAHPVWMLGFLVLTAITFCLFGFLIGLWADSFQKLQIIPLLVVHAADVSGRCVLQHQHAAALLADGFAVQPGGLPHQRPALGLLWRGRRAHWRERGHDADVYGGVSRRGVVGVQDGLPDSALSAKVGAAPSAAGRRLQHATHPPRKHAQNRCMVQLCGCCALAAAICRTTRKP